MNLAINGYGRIGRCILRALYENDRTDEMRIVAINELAELPAIAHLTRFDSAHGAFGLPVSHRGDHLLVADDPILVTNCPDLTGLPWDRLGVDVVLECSGSFGDRQRAGRHLAGGARKVLFSCPAQPDVDATVVYGLNHQQLRPEHTIVSNASCTTNCISHLIRIINDRFSLDQGVITTVHSMMNDQPVIDAYHHSDLRRNRSSSCSIIPVTTELAKGLGRVFPDLDGRFTAVAWRVPTLNVSTMQLTALVRNSCTAEEINRSFREAAAGALEGVLGYTELPLVSCDFNHDPRSAIFDAGQTSVNDGRLVNVMAWFDNEWGYANRMLDTARAMLTA